MDPKPLGSLPRSSLHTLNLDISTAHLQWAPYIVNVGKHVCSETQGLSDRAMTPIVSSTLHHIVLDGRFQQA